MTDISQRKADHLDLATSGDVAFHATTTLFECVRLVHDALPELGLDEIDLSLRVLGKRLKAPLLIAAMTGGTDRAERINIELASIAEERGYAFGLGSQRAMHVDRRVSTSYQVRKVAPSALVLGNIGAVQAVGMSRDQILELVTGVGADALCVHLDPAMEIVQPEGDRDFRGVLERLARLVQELPVPVVAKETGCGLSRSVGARLRAAGIRHVDVSGAGGTSWVAIEGQRVPQTRMHLGRAFREWGIPTAASVAWLADQGFNTLFATGGIHDGLEVAKALALGATAAGIARPVLQRLDSGGRAAVLEYLAAVEGELRAAMLLVGARALAELRQVPRVVVGELRDWLAV
ncbi:MAG: type 2 isopentenyl-diphosphate Delta-isomerase [Polyangiaceae bacterium]|nr:type 2 isopentenyl-diphosphate Delta-isomerase [Polyangiaceae bacterium]